MVTSLMKLGLPQNALLENRRLAIDLAALMVRWEQQRLTSPPTPLQVGQGGLVMWWCPSWQDVGTELCKLWRSSGIVKGVCAHVIA